MLTVVFSHGKTTGPFIRKYQWLRELTEELQLPLFAVDYTSTRDPARRLDMLNRFLDGLEGIPFLVGNSMGGYVSAVVAEQRRIPGTRVVLLAPALYMPGYPEHPYVQGAWVVHGRHDRTIPCENSLRYNPQSLLVDDDHRLLRSKKAVLDIVAEALRLSLAERQVETRKPLLPAKK